MTTTSTDKDGNIHVVVDMHFCKVSGRRRCILPTGHEKHALLVETMARARKWFGMIQAGTYDNGQQLADALGFDQSYVGKNIRLAFLSPQIVRKVMDGDLPPDISQSLLFEVAKRPLWSDQHEMLGIE